VPVDLAKPEGPAQVFSATQKANIEIDILVNNAGYGNFGDYEDIPLSEELEQLQLNIVTLSHLTKLYAPAMLKRKRGHILNLASTAAFQPGPLMSVYYATKAYVLSYSLALANEFRGKGVYVTCLCPGPTSTGFQKRASLEDSKLMNMATMDAKTVAEQGYRAMLKGKPLKINGALNWITAQATRFAPRTWVAALARRMQERRKR
jgi:short-subunit dehydrogenase